MSSPGKHAWQGFLFLAPAWLCVSTEKMCISSQLCCGGYVVLTQMRRNFLMNAFAVKDLTLLLLQVKSCAMCTNVGCSVGEVCSAMLLGFCVRESWEGSLGSVQVQHWALTAHTQALGALPPLYGLLEFHIVGFVTGGVGLVDRKPVSVGKVW